MKAGKEERHLLKNIGTNGLGLFVTVFNQLLLLPIYLHCWTTEMYGDWIALSAISVFFASSDLGFTTVFTNDFVVNHTRNLYDKCRQILTNNYCFLLIVFVPLTILLIGFLWCVDLVSLLGLHSLENSSARWILLVLVIHVFLTMAGKVPNAVYRASHLAHKAFLIDNLVWLLESIIIAISLFAHFSPLAVAIGMTLPRLFILMYKFYDTNRLFPYAFTWRDFSFDEVKKAISPSVSMASFPFSNTVIMQGLSLVVNKYFGASELVLFNTTRTLANMIKFGSSIVTTSFYPEYSLAYGNKNTGSIKKLNRYCSIAAILISLAATAILLPFGKFIYEIWTQGKVSFSGTLMLSFLFVVLVDNFWNALVAPLVSTNKHRNLGFISLSLATLVVLLAIAIARYNPPLFVIVLIQLFIHIPMLIMALRSENRFVRQLEMESKTL